MAGIASNLKEITGQISGLGKILDLTHAGKTGRPIGIEAVAVVAGTIKTFKGNTDPKDAKKKKRRRGGDGLPGTEGLDHGGAMAARELDGIVAISPTAVAVIFEGREEAADDSALDAEIAANLGAFFADAADAEIDGMG